MARSLAHAYLAGEARAFFPAHPANPSDRRAAVARAARPLSPAVADELERQNAALAPSPARDAHLQALRRGAAAVVTGQQVGLFLGPLFTIYKAATAIVAARALSQETATPVVPVFWLQTEDHDLAEIAWCEGLASGSPLRLELPFNAQNRVSIAHLTLPHQVRNCLDELRASLAGHAFAEEHLARLERHYQPGKGWAQAFAGVLAELFAPEGLILIDPRTPALARAGASVHRTALLQAEPLATALRARDDALRAASFEPAVHVRKSAPLSFFHPHGPTGPRFRLAPSQRGKGLAEVGGTGFHSQDELLAALERDPLCFSTSALLRPLLQDTLLPTAAYVGGPGEIAYFAQLAPAYEHFGLTMPLVVHRAQFRVLDSAARRSLARLGLEAADAALPLNELLRRIRAPRSAELSPTTLGAELLQSFDSALKRLSPALDAAGTPLDAARRKARAAVERAVNRLANRYGQALTRRDEALVADLERLRLRLFPEGVPQERRYGVFSIAARFGERAFLERVLQAIDPFGGALKDLTL